MARVRIPIAHGHTRLRLHRMLDTVRATGLALVVAPAGSGKTTLLARWADVLDSLGVAAEPVPSADLPAR